MRDNKQEPVQFIKDYCDFGENRVYILMAIARKKYNPQMTHNTELVFRKVLRKEDGIEHKYREMKNMMEGEDKNFYLYLSVNARNVLKGFFNFKHRMEDFVKQRMLGNYDVLDKFKKVDACWLSELARPRNRDEKYFQFDLDDKERLDELLDHLESVTEIIAMRETRNGYHIITEPYNYPKHSEEYLDEDCEIKKDGNLFLEFVGDDSV